MKNIDIYTKAVLTVIAVCLVILTLRNTEIIPSVKASATAEREVISSSSGTVDVRIVGVEWGAKIPVSIDVPYGGIDVNVKSPVKLDIPYSGLDVTVKNYRDFK